MNTHNRLYFWLRIFVPTLLVIVIVSSAYVFVLGAMTFQDFEGNFEGSFKVDPPVDAIVYFNSDGSISSIPTERLIEFDVSDDKISLSFQATGVVVTKVYLKGGDGYRVYSFDPGVTEATELISPTNPGENTPVISHYGFVEVGVPTETTTTTTATTNTTTTTTTGSSETTATTTTTTTTETTATTTTTTTTETTATTTGTTTETLPSETTTQVTTSTASTTATTPATTPSETIPEDLPKTGEGDAYAMIVSGIALLLLAASLSVWRWRLKKRRVI